MLTQHPIDSQLKADSELNADTELKVDTELKADTELNADTELKVDTELKADTKPKVNSGDSSGSYQLTKGEEAVLAKLAHQLNAAEPPLPRLKKSDDGKSISLDHPKTVIGYVLLMNAIGTVNNDFAEGILRHLARISKTNDEINESDLNFALAAVAGSKPNDQDEAMIGVLRVASYLNAVMMAGRLHNAQTIVEADSAERAFNRCARTVAILSDTLMRMRSGCEQKVTVENLPVNDNTQAANQRAKRKSLTRSEQ
jgi:hypothetical protein